MTQVKFDFGRLSESGVTSLANAKVSIAPTSRFVNGGRIVMPDAYEVTLDENGTATATVPPTDGTYAYVVRMATGTAYELVRYVTVPDSTQAVNFAALPDVDPSTLAPLVQSGPVLAVAYANSLAEAKTLSAQLANTVIMYPDSDEPGA